MKEIVTHSGQAHADDLLATAYMVCTDPTIERFSRRDPTSAELDDPNVIVIDVGGRYEPQLNNFDHHQFRRDAAPTCAFSMCLGERYQAWSTIYPWVRGLEVMDSKGPFYVANWLGVDAKELMPFTMSPFAGYFLRLFENTDGLLAEPIRSLMQGLIDHVSDVEALWDHFDATTKFTTVNRYRVAVFDTTGPQGIESWLEYRARVAHCIVSRDDRGPGLSLFRRNDEQGIDFSKCADMPNVIFAHTNGFVAKISDDKWEEVFERSTS